MSGRCAASASQSCSGGRSAGTSWLPGPAIDWSWASEDCDVLRFRSLVREAHRLAGTGQREEALRSYLGSLAVAAAPAGDDRLWALPAFVGLEDERVRAIIATVEQCETPDEFAAVLPILRAATGRHRLDEALHAHLMTALTRTGRPAEALAVYAAIRVALEGRAGALAERSAGGRAGASPAR